MSAMAGCRQSWFYVTMQAGTTNGEHLSLAHWREDLFRITAEKEEF